MGPLCVPGLAWRPYLNSRRIKGTNNKNVGEAGLSLPFWAPACPGQTICVLIPGHLLKRKALTPPGFPVSGRFWSQRGEKDDAFKPQVLQRLMGASKPVAHGVQLSPANSPDLCLYSAFGHSNGPLWKTGPGTLPLTGPDNGTGQMPGACIPQQALICESLLTDGLRSIR